VCRQETIDTTVPLPRGSHKAIRDTCSRLLAEYFILAAALRTEWSLFSCHVESPASVVQRLSSLVRQRDMASDCNTAWL